MAILVTIAQGILQVPPHRAEDGARFKVAPFEGEMIPHGKASVIGVDLVEIFVSDHRSLLQQNPKKR
jgi:hypothetical protein